MMNVSFIALLFACLIGCSMSQMSYIEDSSFALPASPISLDTLVPSKDLSQPDRLFFLGYYPYAPSVYSVDMRTGQSLPTFTVSGCGHNVTRIHSMVALSDSIMVYTSSNITSFRVVIMQVNHTSGNCMRAWPFSIPDTSRMLYNFAVDEARQQMALYTSVYANSSFGLSLISLNTGSIIANSTIGSNNIYFDDSLGSYLFSPSDTSPTPYYSWQQLNRTDLSVIRVFIPSGPDSNSVGNPIFYDQFGTIVMRTSTIGQLGYVYANGTWNEFVSTRGRAWVQLVVGAMVNHDVIGIMSSSPSPPIAVRFRQVRSSQSSSSSSTGMPPSSGSIFSSSSLSTAPKESSTARSGPNASSDKASLSLFAFSLFIGLLISVMD